MMPNQVPDQNCALGNPEPLPMNEPIEYSEMVPIRRFRGRKVSGPALTVSLEPHL